MGYLVNRKKTWKNLKRNSSFAPYTLKDTENITEPATHIYLEPKYHHPLLHIF